MTTTLQHVTTAISATTPKYPTARESHACCDLKPGILVYHRAGRVSGMYVCTILALSGSPPT
eukprot:CAMPEP_0184358102 /NCGR_PEP_ID=MMETSP1089-20130417/112673_1 /TAXON_ID=38269 ORGANISM="Gloeochaete wittrockiana, Strain SAG46.84" /NCGR_SAMPLE_ID=MMETSP1089 /ASSEMBLY_ACC=CAM_ASM_000445 /LENGTH=61 /DNA_ID=CAMNT_0026696243 /DNA_START=30 /DNA_END=212 /DNA_ORIENTATION=-